MHTDKWQILAIFTQRECFFSLVFLYISKWISFCFCKTWCIVIDQKQPELNAN